MKTKVSVWKRLAVVAAAVGCCALNLPAQTPPTITTQPTSQTNLAGTNVTFTVAVSGTGPFTYQWLFNGTNLPNNIITTVAGNGSGTYAGDALPATSASLHHPYAVAFDAAGNMYIADYLNQRVRKVDTNGILTTVAGGGVGGDGSVATSSSLSFPTGVALDAAGNLYIADSTNNRIRKVDTNGLITTVAGNGNPTFGGDGGAATNASLNCPWGVSLDAAGNLYIADSANNRVRKVDRTATITTVAGDGNPTFGGDGGPATAAALNCPTGVAFDAAGNMYIADYNNNRIRKVAPNTAISTVAGNGAFLGDGGPAYDANLWNPAGVACDAAGNLYIADTGDNRIRKVDTNGIITTVAGEGGFFFWGDGGPATNAYICEPDSVALDASGNLYIADTMNDRVREVSLDAGNPAFRLGNVSASDAGEYSVLITSPYGSVTSAVAVMTVLLPPSILVQPASQVLFNGANATLSVTATGTPPLGYSWYLDATNLIQNGPSATLTVNGFSTNNAGNYTVVITNAWAIVTSQVAALTLALPPTVATQPINQTVLGGGNATFSVEVAGPGPFTYQWQFNGTNLPNGIITTVAGSGAYISSGNGGRATDAGMSYPNGVGFDVEGNMYISERQSCQIRKVATNGVITTVAGNGTYGLSGDGGQAVNACLSYPSGVFLDKAGNLYIADATYNMSIRKVDTNGIITTVAGKGPIGQCFGGYSGDGGPATNAYLSTPNFVALDAFGTMYIADTGNNRIRKVNTNGIITTVAGTGTPGYTGDGVEAVNTELNQPCGVGCDATGNLYIADTSNNRIRKVDTNGIITTVAGTDTNGYSGDGGPATNATLNGPATLTFDAFGNLYIADSGNNAIRKVDTNGIISTVAGNGTAGYSGDGGAATNAALSTPNGPSVDACGNLYIADRFNCRVREVALSAMDPTVSVGNVGATNVGNYSVVVTSPYGSVTSAVATLTVEAPPVIAVQPASQVVLSGTSPVFAVSAIGSGPFGYLWYFAGTNLLQSSTNNSITLVGVSSNNAGNYTVVITNVWGSVTSAVASLTMAEMPFITGQPASQLVVAGSSATFSVTGGGPGSFWYLWYFDTTNLLQSSALNTLALPSVSSNNAGSYSVVVTNVCGSVTSQVAVLSVLIPTEQPASMTVPVGETALFSVAVSATGPCSYQWQFNGTNLPNNIITTVAGGGSNPDGDPALGANLNAPEGVAFDKAGNMYIADTSNNRVRIVTSNGIISTIAGNGSNTYAGDGGAATNASLKLPACVALDAIGNLYIADSGNNRIRKVSTNGVITTVAGTNAAGFSGDGGAAVNAQLYSPTGVAVDGSENIYIADQNHRIRRVGTNGIITTVAGTNASGFSGDGGPAVNAKLYFPSGMAVDGSGNLYIADEYNNRIRMVGTNGIINTVAGGGSGGDSGQATNAKLSWPSGVALDASGNLYIADCRNNRIRFVATNGIITTIAGSGVPNGPLSLGSFSGDGGPATSATLNWPSGVASDAFGNLYIADFRNSRIREVFLYAGSPSLTLPNVGVGNAGSYTVVISNSYGSVTSAVATLTVLCPPAIVVPPASQWVLTGSNATLSVTATGSPPLYCSWYDNATNLVQSGLNNALTVQDFAPNNVGSYTVVVTNNYGSVTSQVATLTTAYPPSITTSPGSQAVLAGVNLTLSVAAAGTGPFSYQWQFNGTNLPTNIITTVAGTNASGYSGDSGPATNAELNWPVGVALDKFGNLYIADTDNDRVRKVAANGIITTVAGNGPTNINTGQGGFSGDGGPATNANLYNPIGVALDAFGNMYIVDCGNCRIRKLATNGIITTVAGCTNANSFSGDGGPAAGAFLPQPKGVAVDALGDLFIMANSSVRKVDTHGIITRVVGGGTNGLGDGGPATNASLGVPVGAGADALCLDALGNLYIADCWNERIRKVDTNGIISTVAGCGSYLSGGYSGDGGPATNASLDRPSGVAVDAAGNLYIADMLNNLIRRVDTNGIITTVAGIYMGGYSGDGGFSGDGGPANYARLNWPCGLTVDAAGNLYIADTYNNRIREIHFAESPSLAITNASGINAGSYAVVVTSPYGSVTSAVATLTVQAPPVITLQPTNQTVLAGSSPTFSVAAVGSGTFGYVWYLAATNLIQNGASPSLTLPCVFTNNAGSYTVVVINTWGSVTSAVAALTVTIPTNAPQIMTSDGFCGFLTNQFGFNLCGAFGQTIVLDGSTDLVNWTPLVTNTVGAANPFYFYDPCWTNFGLRFYRGRLQ